MKRRIKHLNIYKYGEKIVEDNICTIYIDIEKEKGIIICNCTEKEFEILDDIRRCKINNCVEVGMIKEDNEYYFGIRILDVKKNKNKTQIFF